jgi:hypothetical protein
LEVRRLGPESPVPGGRSLWSGKVPGGSRPNLRTKNSENTFWAGVSGPGKGRNSWNQNDHNLSIWTLFSMILGSLESQQWALLVYA